MPGLRPQNALAVNAVSGADDRYDILDAAIRKHQARKDALIPLMHRAQELFGYLHAPLLHHIARALRLPPSRVQGVATFYHLFRLKPRGEHTCVVCMGTACFAYGGKKLVEAVEAESEIRPGGTTADGKLSLIVARCIGACGIAPAVVLDDQTVGNITPETLTTHVRELIHGS